MYQHGQLGSERMIMLDGRHQNISDWGSLSLLSQYKPKRNDMLQTMARTEQLFCFYYK